MTNAITGAGTVRLMGRDLSLVYDLDACDYLYDQGLDPWGDGLSEALNKRKPGVYRAFLLAGLRREHPEIKAEELGKLRAPEIMRAFAGALKAFTAQMGGEDASANPLMAGGASPA